MGKRLVDAFVVVVSILAAFSLEAWWEHRQEREALAEDLANVAAELNQNREHIEFNLDLMRRAVVGSNLLVSAMDAAPGESAVTVPDTVAFWAMQGGTFDPSLGAVDALLASGRLGQVRDAELRTMLAGLRDRVSDAVEEQLRAVVILDEQFVPEFADVPIHPGVVDLTREFWSLDRVPGRELVSRVDVLHPASGSLRNFASQRGGLLIISMVEMEELSVEMAEIVDRIGVIAP